MSISSRTFYFGILAGLGLIIAGASARAELRTMSGSERTEAVQKWCREVGASVAQLKWKLDPCASIHWEVGGTSVKGRPLVYAEFGDASAPNTTVVFSMVHGDEVTPLYLAIQLAHWMVEHGKDKEIGKYHVVVAPLVNPDGFFGQPRTRMNARGVDVNRNFETRDWKTQALASWKSKYKSNPRRFPGWEPRSEPETLFQEDLIRKFRPQKVLSVHSPLNFLDYDGPNGLSLARFSKEYVSECLRLRQQLKAISAGFFPGSLGNYAGQELGIPTVTLELPTADPRKAEGYWQKFSQGIRKMIEFTVPNYAIRADRSPT